MNKSIVTFGSFCLTLLLGAGLIWPQYQELGLLRQQIEAKETEILRREEYFQGLKKTAQELEQYQEQLAKIDSALPTDPELPILFDFLQKASAQSGLVLKSISHSVPRSSPDLEGLKETEVSLTVSGVYPSFKNFLSVLETSSRLIEVELISFSAAAEEGPREFNLKIKVYSY